MKDKRSLREFIFEVVIAGEYDPDQILAKYRPDDPAKFIGMKTTSTDDAKNFIGMTSSTVSDDPFDPETDDVDTGDLSTPGEDVNGATDEVE